MKRILVISHKYPSEKNRHAFGFVHSRSKIYLKKGMNIKVYVPSSNKKILKYKYEGVDVFKGTYNDIKRVFEEFDPDLIAVHAPTPNMLIHVNKLHRPTVVWIHGVEVLLRTFHHYLPPFGLENHLKRLYFLVHDISRNLILRRELKKVNAVIYVSKWMKRMSEKYLLLDHPMSYVIPNPVDTELFKPLGNLEDRTISGISVRGLEWKYGIDIAIRAFSDIPVKLVVIGKGSLEKYLRNMAKSLNSNVEFINKGVDHEKLPEVYSKFVFFVAPSRTEAQGVAMCEAMASGLPVIATKVGGIPEFVKHGFNGLLTNPEDPVSLRKAVIKITSDQSLLSTMSTNARKFVLNNLSHDIIFKKEYQVFKAAIESY